jgi:hypothetical protein
LLACFLAISIPLQCILNLLFGSRTQTIEAQQKRKKEGWDIIFPSQARQVQSPPPPYPRSCFMASKTKTLASERLWKDMEEDYGSRRSDLGKLPHILPLLDYAFGSLKRRHLVLACN